MSGIVRTPNGDTESTNVKVNGNEFSFDVSFNDMTIKHDCSLQDIHHKHEDYWNTYGRYGNGIEAAGLSQIGVT